MVKADTKLDLIYRSAGSNVLSCSYLLLTQHIPLLVSNRLEGLIGRIEQQAWRRRRPIATAAHGGDDVTTPPHLKLTA